MNILIVTDAWEPQVNGVVRTLKQTRQELEHLGHIVDVLSPLEFRTIPCPTYPEIQLSLFPGRKIAQRIKAFHPDAIHIATEGPLGLAARRYCIRNKLPFTTAYHSRFPEYVQLRFGIPLSWTYAWLARFHNAAEAVMAPTHVVVKDLEARGFKKVVMWSRGVDLKIFSPGERDRLQTRHPIFVYVGRVAVEKNIEAFLQLDLPGSKWVCGDGPAAAQLRLKYTDINWLGVLSQEELAKVYNAADSFVFPSKTDTFGLVLLEAMACGCPVAAYPVTGPIDVIGKDGPGALCEDLQKACLDSLKISREDVRKHAEKFSWAAASQQFLTHLHPFTPTAQNELALRDVYKRQASAFALHSGQAAALGWPDHESLWRNQAAFIQTQAGKIRAFYHGALPDAGPWLVSQNIRYIVWSRFDQARAPAAFALLRQQLDAQYAWRVLLAENGVELGVWERRN